MRQLTFLLLVLAAACAHHAAAPGAAPAPTSAPAEPPAGMIGPNIVKVVWGGADDTLAPAPSVEIAGHALIDQVPSLQVTAGQTLGTADATKLPAGEQDVVAKGLSCEPAKITLPAEQDVIITCKK